MAYTQTAKKQMEENLGAEQGIGEAGQQAEQTDSNSLRQAMLQTAAEDLDYSSGVRRELPRGLKGKLSSHFGYSVDNLEFRESSDVDAIGAQAYAAGNVVHFRPGQFRPDTHQGQKMIGHEVAHVLQQAEGSVDAGAGSVSLDTGKEDSADRHGEAVASMKEGDAEGGHEAMPTASISSAPVQGWGVGGFLSVLINAGKTKKKGFVNKVEGGHELLTRKAAQKAEAAAKKEGLDGGKSLNLSDKNMKSLRAGARFNDVYHKSNLGFGISYGLTHTNEFINQTHHGDMQFLHSMDTSGGNLEQNVKKMRRWAQFAADVYKNDKVEGSNKSIQETNMLEYLLNHGAPDDPIQEMLLSTMIERKHLAKLEKEAREETDTEDAYKERRMQKIRAFATEKFAQMNQGDSKTKRKAKRGLSDFAKMSIGDFFTGGNKNLDAGYVALGSASHMLEDSFAGSHAIRGYNTKYENQIGGMEIGEGRGAAIADKTTGIMINANYDTQDEKKHSQGDFLRYTDEKAPEGADQDDVYIANTQGAGLAQDVAAQFMYMAAKGGDGMKEYLESVTQIDQNAQAAEGQLTGSGRQYDKTVLQEGEDEESARVNGLISSYQEDMQGSIGPNILYSAAERNGINERHLNQLSGILMSTTDQNVRSSYIKHIKEIEVESRSMLQQTLDKQAGEEENRTQNEQKKKQETEELIKRLGNTAKWAAQLYNFYNK